MPVFVIFVCILFNEVVCHESGLGVSINIFDDSSWVALKSKALHLDQPLFLKCITAEHENITLIRKAFDNNVFITLAQNYSDKLEWGVNRTGFVESGIYECNSRGFSDIITVHVYSIIGLNDVIIPTVEHVDKIANIKFVTRQVDNTALSQSERSWMSCTCVVGSLKLLDLVTVTWRGGLLGSGLNQSQLNEVYARSTVRDRSVRAITARLRLKFPVLDQRVYGQYNCVFSFSNSETVAGTVHLKVPPILYLTYDPPPLPPANSSGRFVCTASICNTIEDFDKTNWTQACKLIIAYPPVMFKNLGWAWTQPQWAAYTIRRVKEFGKASLLADYSALNTENANFHEPLQILERRRRSLSPSDAHEAESSVTTLDKPDLTKSGPVLFWCWAENDVGQTTVWWPGPIRNQGYSIWSSVWWPILGVTLELISLVIVFAFFRYCRRQRSRQGGYGNFAEPGSSFGLSRLLDHDSGTDQVELKITGSSVLTNPGGLSGPIPYMRLSDQSQNKFTNTLHKSTNHPNYSVDGYVNPNLVPDSNELEVQTNNVNVNDQEQMDDYYWDSDTEQANDSTTTSNNNNNNNNNTIENNNNTIRTTENSTSSHSNT